MSSAFSSAVAYWESKAEHAAQAALVAGHVRRKKNSAVLGRPDRRRPPGPRPNVANKAIEIRIRAARAAGATLYDLRAKYRTSYHTLYRILAS